jgi:hypothetical protein
MVSPCSSLNNFTELWSRLSNWTGIQVRRLGANLEEADEPHGMRLPVKPHPNPELDGA